MSDARDGAREALRSPPGKLHWLDRIYRLVSATISFGLYFLLGNVAAYLFSLLTYERWDGGIALTGAAIGALVGLASGRKAYLGFGAERGDTHGSARFARLGEVRADLGADAGLIVGRERNRRNLLTPDEVIRLGAGTEILLRQGRRPALACNVRYYEDREFAGIFDAA